MIKITGKIGLGVILIVVGLLIFLGNYGVDGGDFTLLIVGGAFIVAYFQSARELKQGKIGLLITGTIILMVGLHSIITDYFFIGDLDGPLFFFLLGTAFWLVYFIHSIHFESTWPAITGGSIYLFGIFVLIIEYWDKAAGFLRYIWGFALLALGIWIIVRTLKQQRK